MEWVKSNDRKPTATGTYFGKFNGNELCFVYVTGGEAYKLRFTNAAEFSSGFRDMNKIEYEWLDESGIDENEKVKRLLHDLTPGGSEFYNDPEYCAKWVRENREENHYTLSNIIKGLKDENEKLKKENEELKQDIDLKTENFAKLLDQLIKTEIKLQQDIDREIELEEALRYLVNDVRNKPNDTRYATALKKANEVLNK